MFLLARIPFLPHPHSTPGPFLPHPHSAPVVLKTIISVQNQLLVSWLPFYHIYSAVAVLTVPNKQECDVLKLIWKMAWHWQCACYQLGICALIRWKCVEVTGFHFVNFCACFHQNCNFPRAICDLFFASQGYLIHGNRWYTKQARKCW